MPTTPPIRLSGGLNNNDDPAFIEPTQLQKTVGCRYAPDSPRLLPAQGRDVYNSQQPGSGAYASIEALDYDEDVANDLIIVQRGTSIWKGDTGDSSLMTEMLDQKVSRDTADSVFSRTEATEPIVASKLANAWLLADGLNRPALIENNGRARNIGLAQPTGEITLEDAGGTGTTTRALSNGSLTVNGSSGLNTWATFTPNVNDVDGLDGDVDGVATSEGVAAVDTYSIMACKGDGEVDRYYTWATTGSDVGVWSISINYSFLGIDTDHELQVEPYVQGVLQAPRRFILPPSNDAHVRQIWFEQVTNDNVDIENVTLFLKLRQQPQPGGLYLETTAEVFIYDVLAHRGDDAAGPVLTTGAGIRYAITETRQYQRQVPGLDDEQTIEHQSALSPLVPPHTSPPLTFTSGWSGVKITLPTNAASPESNYYNIYRSIDAATADETLSWDRFSRLARVPIDTTSWVDRMDAAGHPLDFQDANLAPPFLFVQGFLVSRNDPPPDQTDVVGEFQGSALYASGKQPGRFWWSVPLEPDSVPLSYNDATPGRVTGFAEVGSLLVFTKQSVSSYQYLPIANDFDFAPYRERTIISETRGAVSRRGIAVIDIPGAPKLAAFVAGDGLYAANSAATTIISPMIDWPTTVDRDALGNSELRHDAADRRMILTFDDEAGDRQSLSFYYGRQPGNIVAVVGPTPWPDGGTTTIYVGNTHEVYTLHEGVIYKERVGRHDAANLESANGTITFNPQTAEFTPFGVNTQGKVKKVLVRFVQADAEVDVTFHYNIGSEPGDSGSHTWNNVSTNRVGWASLAVPPTRMKCETCSLEFNTTDTNFMGVAAITFELEQEGQLTTLRGAEG